MVLKLLDFKDITSKSVSTMIINQLIITLNSTSISLQEQFMLFDAALDLVWEKMNTGHWCTLDSSWRILYTIFSVLKIRVLLKFTTDYASKQ